MPIWTIRYFKKTQKRTIDTSVTLSTPYNHRTAPERLTGVAGVYPARYVSPALRAPESARRQRVSRIIVGRWARFEDEGTKVWVCYRKPASDDATSTAACQTPSRLDQTGIMETREAHR